MSAYGYLRDTVEQHMANGYTVVKFMSKGQASRKRVIWNDTLKCMAIGVSMFTILNFANGRSHFFKYVKRGSQGALFGLAYSFQFTSRKVVEWYTDDIFNQ